MNDDDKNLDKTLNRLMIGGAALVGLSLLAGTYDAGYQAGAKDIKLPTIVHGNYTINNSINLNSDDAGSVSK
jgi:hypothetical protein